MNVYVTVLRCYYQTIRASTISPETYNDKNLKMLQNLPRKCFKNTKNLDKTRQVESRPERWKTDREGFRLNRGDFTSPIATIPVTIVVLK